MRLRLLSVVLAAVVVAGCSNGAEDEASTIVRTTTTIAGAGVVGLERDTRKACPTPAPAEGTVDPKRIVVLSTQALDTVCALGLWERVVGAATLERPTPQPSYLGTGIAAIPSIGPLGAPDAAKVAALQPDLVLGSTPVPGFDKAVFAGADGNWQQQVQRLGAALGRSKAIDAALADYRKLAADTGAAVTAGTTQASVVRFAPGSIRVLGSDSFAGQVLTDVGVQRPAHQRGTSFELPENDLKRAEGDLTYVVLVGEAGKEYGTKVMKGNRWQDLGVATDRRVFAVEAPIWEGNALVAARALVADLKDSLNAYVTG